MERRGALNNVQLHPHFVAARDYADVCSIVKLLKEPIDDEDFEPTGDEPYLPAAYTSTIHLGDTLSVRSPNDAATAPHRRNSKLGTSSNAAVLPVRVPDSTSTADDGDAPLSLASADPISTISDDDHDDVGAGSNGVGRGPVSPFTGGTTQPPTRKNDSRLRLARSQSALGAGPRRPRVLCIWDVDDTLVATGVSGLRQNMVFREQDLITLFRSAGDNARHLLLSQGSIDDVFEEQVGRLRCVKPFFERSTNVARRSGGIGRPGSGPAASGKGRGDARASVSSGPVKEKSSFADLLRCGGSRQVREQPSGASSVCGARGGGAACAPSGTNEHDMRHFAPGTVVVRLTAINDRGETVEDAAFLDNPNASPTCSRPFNGQIDDKTERLGRWLVLRPELWGITLASTSTPLPPTRRTAFVNGKVYRKMDVVWSLAMSGEWDSVVFVDNNLSEVGVVRYGLQMSDVLNLRSQRKVYRLFQADYLLLATAAKLREMELRYGRDVTKPPGALERSNSLLNTAGTPLAITSAGVAATANGGGGGGVKSGRPLGPTTAGPPSAAPTASIEDAGALTPSKSAATSSSDSGGHRGAARANGVGAVPGVALASPAARLQGGYGAADDVNIVTASTSTGRGGGGGSGGGVRDQRPAPDVDAENLSLTSLPPPIQGAHGVRDGDGQAASTMSFNSLVRPLPLPCKDVDLIVVNLHMTSADYRRVLTTARTNSDGQRSLQRVNPLPGRYVGQPVFVGDRSCTDEQYKAILRYFQEAESTVFQLIEEEMRVKGYVDLSQSSRWVPATRMVYAPLRVRPTFVPHMYSLYESFLRDVEARLVVPLQRTGGTSSSVVLHTESQQQHYILHRVLPLIDPYLTGELGRAIFDIYFADGTIPRSLAEPLKKTIAKMRTRLQPVPERVR